VVVVDADTAFVEIVNVALVTPLGTVTVAGTVAAATLLLDSATDTPPAGAGWLKVTIPVEVPPLSTLTGFRLSAMSVTDGLTVSVTDRVTPPWVAEMVTAVEALTEVVEIANVALVAPLGTVTVAGTVAAATLLLESATTTPPVGAG
jgi:hypothetical protein